MKNFNFGIESRMLCEEFDPEKMAGGVDDFSKGDQGLMSEAKKEMAEETNKRKKEEMKLQLSIDGFNQEAAAISLRKDTATANANRKALKEVTALNNEFSTTGGEVTTHREKLEKIEELKRKEIDAADTAYRAAIGNLRKKNPDGYRNSSKRYDY